MANGYTQVDPTAENRSCYWVAITGNCFAVVPPDAGQSCIASVESDMVQTFGARGGGWNDTYVIWQPKNHTQKTWDVWQKKWSKRTAQGPHF